MRLIFAASSALAIAVAAASASAAPDGLAPGARLNVDPARLPAPYATRSAVNPAQSIDRPAGVSLNVPPGFKVTLFADKLAHPRNLLIAPNGDVIVAESNPGKITILRDADGDGRAEIAAEYARGIARPFGLALRPEGLYVADTEAVWRFDYKPGDLKSTATPIRVTAPGALGAASGHWTRNIAFHPDGTRFYVAIGSASNIGEEEAPRATIQEFRRDGSGQRSFATGLRNAIGIAFYPGSTDLYAAINERDGLGDGLVPDYLTRVQDGGFYGWPYSYIGANPQPGLAPRRPDLVARAIVPDVLFLSHSAPINFAFYDKSQFPVRYRGGAFVALQGSWNADTPTGYMVAFVPFARGADGRAKPAGGYEVFANGFWIDGIRRATVWGKPAGIAVGPDGSLFISDDVGRTIWRVQWAGQ